MLQEGEEKEQGGEERALNHPPSWSGERLSPVSPYLCYRKVKRRSREVRSGLLSTALMERREV